MPLSLAPKDLGRGTFLRASFRKRLPRTQESRGNHCGRERMKEKQHGPGETPKDIYGSFPFVGSLSS